MSLSGVPAVNSVKVEQQMPATPKTKLGLCPLTQNSSAVPQFLLTVVNSKGQANVIKVQTFRFNLRVLQNKLH